MAAGGGEEELELAGVRARAPWRVLVARRERRGRGRKDSLGWRTRTLRPGAKDRVQVRGPDASTSALSGGRGVGGAPSEMGADQSQRR